MLIRDEQGILRKDITVEFCDCDRTGCLKPSAALRYFSDLAGADYAERGMPHDLLWDRGFVFLVSRVRAQFTRPVRAEETITGCTYERGIKGPQFIRCFFLLDENGQRIGEACSAWILCDPNTRRILRPAKFPCSIPDNSALEMGCPDPAKVHLPEDAQSAGARRVVYSDLDANGHVYNANYADIACDFLPLSLFDNPVKGFSIEFSRETLAGDVLDIRTAVREDCAAAAGFVNGAQSFACELYF